MARQKPCAALIFDFNLQAGTIVVVLAGVFAIIILVAPLTQAQTFTVLHSFTGGADGGNPEFGLTMDRGGRLYGTAATGTVFEIKHSGSGWLAIPLANLDTYPTSRLTIGPDGSFYGSTEAGIYNLRPPATSPPTVFAPWSETLIYQFSFNQGLDPTGDLTFDAAGNLYGTNYAGGVVNTCSGGLGCGTVYELSPSHGGWTMNRLYVLKGAGDGTDPLSGVVLDQAGNAYATTSQGYYGPQWGAVIELTPSGSGWTETTLHDFQDGSGVVPVAGLIFDGAGNLYGATVATSGNGGGGTVFQLAPSSGGWNFNNLYTLSSGGSGRTGPWGKLLMDAAGNLYGTTYKEGSYQKGTVFELSPSSGGWIYTLLHDFTGGSDGANPMDGLVMDSSGNLYGSTYAGGTTGSHCDSNFGYQCGVVFEIMP